MIRIKARFHLFEGPGRRVNPVVDGYRPAFDHVRGESASSGHITLIDRQRLSPGETSDVYVVFSDGVVSQGDVIKAREGGSIIGEIEVLDIVSRDWSPD